MRGDVRPGCLAAATLGILAGVLPFAAQARTPAGGESSDLAADARADVEVTVIGAPSDLKWVHGLIGPGALGGEGTRWRRADRFDPAEILDGGHPGPAAGLRCWIDLTDARRARLYFAAEPAERYLIREVELSGNFDEVDRASLAEVLEPSIAALLEDNPTGLTRTETEALLTRRESSAPATATSRPAAPATIAVAAAPAARRPLPVHLGIFYAAQALSVGLPIDQGPGLFLSSGAERNADRRSLAAWLSGQYRLPAEARAAQAGVAVATVAARAGVELRWRQLAARLGAGADFVHVSPERGTSDSSATLAPAHWSPALVMTGAIGAATTIGPGMRLAVNLLADVVPTAVHYDLEIDGRAAPVYSPWRVRPGLALEITLL